MDINTLLPLILAIVAIVPGVWALVNQANKDRTQAKIDMNNAANAAAVSIIAPLQAEVLRLQNRILELEKDLIEKTTKIGELMEAGIDKDAQLRTLRYNIEEMQLRLQAFENKRKATTKEKVDNDTRIKEDLELLEAKKQEVRISTEQTIKELESKSLSNGHTIEGE